MNRKDFSHGNEVEICSLSMPSTAEIAHLSLEHLSTQEKSIMTRVSATERDTLGGLTRGQRVHSGFSSIDIA
ncbi:hypothetical protein GcM3_099011b [Golovinomyces cichoracearum]|uniref:Uncharacterized protein n=1 Tax=Golovinomyces cichoracearum TaxID=62708 RepID=A0A420IBT1_9PEZI|nr:hypothetical protein GcM3_099011b [Golovinomyces cichoracearum]